MTVLAALVFALSPVLRIPLRLPLHWAHHTLPDSLRISLETWSAHAFVLSFLAMPALMLWFRRPVWTWIILIPVLFGPQYRILRLGQVRFLPEPIFPAVYLVFALWVLSCYEIPARRLPLVLLSVSALGLFGCFWAYSKLLRQIAFGFVG